MEPILYLLIMKTLIFERKKTLRYSLGDSSESIILDSIVTSLPSLDTPTIFYFSPDKKDIISTRNFHGLKVITLQLLIA